jgi:hypothetical protein
MLGMMNDKNIRYRSEIQEDPPPPPTVGTTSRGGGEQAKKRIQTLTSRNLIARKFVPLQIKAEALVFQVAIPIPSRPDVQAHRRHLATADDVGALAIARVDAVI